MPLQPAWYKHGALTFKPMSILNIQTILLLLTVLHRNSFLNSNLAVAGLVSVSPPHTTFSAPVSCKKFKFHDVS